MALQGATSDMNAISKIARTASSSIYAIVDCLAGRVWRVPQIAFVAKNIENPWEIIKMQQQNNYVWLMSIF